MGDAGLMGMHVPGMSWGKIRDAAVLAKELGYRCITMGESCRRLHAGVIRSLLGVYTQAETIGRPT